MIRRAASCTTSPTRDTAAAEVFSPSRRTFRRYSAADVKKIAASTSDSLDAHYNFTEFESASKPKKARFHKSLSDGLVVTGTGILEGSQRWARVIVYFFRSKEMKKTYRLAIYEHMRTPEDEPASISSSRASA